MNTDWLQRTKILVGEEGLLKLVNSNVLIVGLGGVGSYAAEFIVRSGIQNLTIVDGDYVDRTNRNRQLTALLSTENQFKTDVMQRRLLDINPELNLSVSNRFITPDDIDDLLNNKKYDYIIDAIDSLSPKISLLVAAHKKKIKVVSCMGAGAKFDPTKIKVTDISKSHHCKLAHMVRKRLHAEHRIYKGIKVVFSDEQIVKESLRVTDGTNFKKSYYGTISYLPAAFGGVCASVVIKGLLEK